MRKISSNSEYRYLVVCPMTPFFAITGVFIFDFGYESLKQFKWMEQIAQFPKYDELDFTKSALFKSIIKC